MKIIRKPPALQRGDAIGIIAPSSPVEMELLERGVRELEAIGYRIVVSDAVLARRGVFAGEHQRRAESLLRFLEDPEIRAIFSARGGYGSNYVVEYLAARPFLRRLKLLTPKIVMGYSDVTSLLLFLNQALGWAVFQGPMVAREFAGGELFYDWSSLEQTLSKPNSEVILESDAWSLRPGEAEGRLLGGCLPMLTATLGTPQEVDTQGTILLLEDVDEKPFRIDRMLFHLRRAGKFRQVKGVIFGEMPGCGGGATAREGLKDVISEAFRGLDIPIIFGFRFGHTTGKCLTIPIGVRARLAAQDKVTLTLLEPAVRARVKKGARKRGKKKV
ncbi:MAG: LD-carboxypeptidase [Acidobacteria bacterium]|nr:LD-carboxypeptidase [Acidobacteriota bacterium]